MLDHMEMSTKAAEVAVRLLVAVVILLVGYALIRIIIKIIRKAMEKSRLDPALHTFILNSVRIVLWVMLAVMILGSLNVPTAPLVTVLGAAGAAVVLALKDSLGNFAGGILILMNKPFHKGDHIQTPDAEGKVEQIDLLYTTLKTFNNTVIVIPNGLLSNTAVKNYTKEPIRRVDCSFAVDYGTDLAQAKEILLTVAAQDPRVLKDPAADAWVEAQKDSAVELTLKVWCNTEDYWSVKYDMEEQVKLAFDVAGINIPFPQMDVHVKK